MSPVLFAMGLMASAPECATHGSAQAHALTELPQVRDKAFDRALVEATQPQATAKAVAAPRCHRAVKVISGENTDAFPRVYTQARDVAYLVALPVKGPADPARLYGLIKVWGSGAVRVDGLFDAIPTDAQLEPLMRNFADGGFDPLTLDPKTGRLIDVNADIPVFLKQTAAAMPAGK